MSNDETNEGQVEDKPEVEETEGESSPEAPSDEQGDSDGTDEGGDEIDYKAELDKARKQLKQAEHTIIEEKKKNKGSDDGQKEPDSNESSDVGKVVEETVRSELDKFKQSQVSDTIDDVLDSITSNPDERELIRHHYENTINQSGYSRDDIVRDIGQAKLLANGPKLISEMKHALDSERSKNRTGGISPQSSTTKEKPATVSLSSGEDALAQRRAKRKGISLEEARKELMQRKAEKSEGVEA